MRSFADSAEHHTLVNKSEAFKTGQIHLKELLKDEKRNDLLFVEADGLLLDATRCRVDQDILMNLFKLYDTMQVADQIKNMFAGHKINQTENRAVGHVGLRGFPLVVDDHECSEDVNSVKSRIYDFANRIRSRVCQGFSGRPLTDVVCVGIGGSYLGVEFVHEAMRTHPQGRDAAKGRSLRFLANVDPIDVRRALCGLDPETTLVIVLSKTFTTAETMLNAQTVREWFLKHYKGDEACLRSHLCAVSTNLELTKKFGIADENVFGFWDWVGGRFSVTSAVGILPLAIQYGSELVEEFLNGCHNIDAHVMKYADKPQKSLPAMMALMSFYNTTYLGFSNVAVLPYCQALLRFPAHIQQLTMESNGKGVCMDGSAIRNENYTGEIYFGEPGTNGQHSFYQLIHQGRVVPCEFIGFTQSQNPVKLSNHPVPSHDELMSNFFAQPDALAIGKTCEDLKHENCPEKLIPHKVFSGNRPSMSLLFAGCLTPFAVGQLLAIYEHRVAVQGFLWGVNSFDQWGVELGKVLAKNVRNAMESGRNGGEVDTALYPTRRLLEYYLSH